MDWHDPFVMTTVIGLPVAFFLLSCLLATVLYVKSSRTKRASWVSRSSVLIQDYKARIPQLSVAYKGREMRSLGVTRILIWNSGRVTLEAKDLESFEPPRVSPELGVEILDISTLTDNIVNASAAHVPGDCPEPDPHFSVELIESAWRLKFRYLEPGRGAIIQVVHTGGPRHRPVGLAGSIVGASPFARRSIPIMRRTFLPIPGSIARHLSYRSKFLLQTGVLLTMIAAYAVVIGLSALRLANAGDGLGVAGAAVFGAALVLAGWLLWWLRTGLPTGLEGYVAEIASEEWTDQADPSDSKKSGRESAKG